jgi:hypothetical protein
MKQFYYYLSQGQSNVEALRSAKLEFWSANSRWAAPKNWAAFALNGDGSHRCARVPSWSWFVAMAGVLVLVTTFSPVMRHRGLRS